MRGATPSAMTIRWKINLSVLALIVVFLVAAAFSVHAVTQNAQQTRTYARMRELSQFTADVRTLLYLQVAAAGDPHVLPEGAAPADWAQTARDDIGVQIRLAESTREKQLWGHVRDAVNALEDALHAGGTIPVIRDLLKTAERDLRDLRHHYDVVQYDLMAATAQTSFRAQVAVGIACALTVLLFLIHFTMIRTWLMNPVDVLKSSADIIGRGNLDHRVPLTGQDELAELARRLDEMAAGLAARQAALVEARELSAIGELCANVAHGLRNPLASIRAAAQLAARRPDTPDPTREAFHEVAQQADLMDCRITKLFQFSRRPSLHPVPTCFRELADTVRAQVQPVLQGNRVTLRVDDQTSATTWHLDREQIAEAFSELVTNAAHHGPEGDEIVLRARVLPAANDSGPRLQVEVVDHGSGMSAPTLKKAFDLFFTARPGGTGMGLALVQRIIERHGGHVSITSAVGCGTTVEVVLKNLSIQEGGTSTPGREGTLNPVLGVDYVNGRYRT